MRQDAVNAIDAVKPYKGGNDTLWRLHKLNNIDKHRFIVTVGSSFQSIDLGAYMSAHVQQSFPGLDFPIVSAFLKVEDILFPLKVGDEVFIDAPDAELKENMTFRFTVSLRESGIIEGEPLLETLQGMADLVDNLVSDFAPLL